MGQKFSSYKDANIKILLVEVLLFFGAIFSSGYFLNNRDPLSIHGNASYFLIFLAVVTLYYGIFAGITGIILSGPLLYIFYKPFPLNFFLYNLLMILIFGEFHFYWIRTIKNVEEKNEYIEEKFEELRKNYFFLKLSYDQIEKSYITKPVTIRGEVQRLKKMIVGEKASYQDLLSIIAQLFSIERASLYVSGSPMANVANIGEAIKLDMDDPLVMKSLEEGEYGKESISYLPSILGEKEGNGSEYLAVIPVVLRDSVKAICLINQISFTEYTKDNLLLMHLFLYYSFQLMETLGSMGKDAIGVIDTLGMDFTAELDRLYKIWKKFRIESTIVAYTLDPEESRGKLFSFLEDKVRSLDMVSCFGDTNVILVLLPFTPVSGAKIFVQRIDSDISGIMGKTFQNRITKEILMVDREPENLKADINIQHSRDGTHVRVLTPRIHKGPEIPQK